MLMDFTVIQADRQRFMTRIVRFLLVSVWISIITGCATAPNIAVRHDPIFRAEAHTATILITAKSERGIDRITVSLLTGNTVSLAKAAKVFDVPTILTTVIEERGGYILKQLQDVFPEQKPINRTWINTWQDPNVTDLVNKSGRKQLIIAGLWTEVCVAMPAIQAAGEGYDVFVVTDACGGASAEAHEMAIKRMVDAGVTPITWIAVMSEWQRDWAREKTAAGVIPVFVEHGGASGVAYAWEVQLMGGQHGAGV